MKKIFLYTTLLFTFLQVNAQVLINKSSDESDVNSNAILELRSDNQALIVPKLTSEAVKQLSESNLPGGTIVFDVNTNQLIGWNGSKWQSLFGGNYNPSTTITSSPIPPTTGGFSGYYKEVEQLNLSGYALKTALSKLISKNYRDNGYDGLWDTYRDSDRDKYYENDNTILDIYSENPSGTDPYVFRYSSDQCGTYNKEGDCYNREHIVPQSLFDKSSPMRNDAHFIVPTDGKVNSVRSNYSFGNVNLATDVSRNGSKLGANKEGDIVFEPIDEFKGDVARMIFYFVTRYENKLRTFSAGKDILTPSDEHKGINDKLLKVLKEWHKNDPVSQRERDRNDAIQARQNNRNPFIDHPEWVSTIWGN